MRDDDDLGEEDYSEETPIFSRDRRLVTQSYDLSVNTLSEQWEDETLILPDIQREYVWDNRRASRLVESMLLNVPIPPVYFAETEDVRYLIIDGHQRIMSIVRFLNNEFALTGLRMLQELNHRRFHQLPERDQRQIRTRVIRAIIITSDSDPGMKFEVFERLNTGSIALNAQEVRNSTHRGPMNELIKSFVRNDRFRACVGTPKPRRRMVDNELVLRFLALEHGWRDYRPPLKEFLNGYLARANKWDQAELEDVAVKFGRAATLIYETLGEGAFRPMDRYGHPTERSVNRALAEVQLTCFSWVTHAEELAQRREQVLGSLADLYRNPDFADSIQLATADRRRTLKRLHMFSTALIGSDIHLDHRVPSEADE